MNEVASEAPVAVGQLIAGKYRVERVLGQGGMGLVVAARHVELDAIVAIKLLRTSEALSVESVERFQREGRAAAKLQGDHIARVSDVGQLEDGTPFMVLEYLEGADLAHIARGGPLPPAVVAELLAQAAEGVGEAHDKGIVHRDLKPSNLFVTRTSKDACRVKVLDFGISKLRGGATALAETALTETAHGTVLGTPMYMSPEQMRSSRDVDARTDVWSLGVVAYELLTGQVPWTTVSMTALVVDVTMHDPPSPSLLCPDIPEALEALVMRCLDKEPEARFANAAELCEALSPFRAGNVPATQLLDGVGAAEPGMAYARTTPGLAPQARNPEPRTTAPSARAMAPPRAQGARPLVLTLAGIALLGLVGGAVILGTRGWSDERERDEVATPERDEVTTPGPSLASQVEGAAASHPRPCGPEVTPPCAEGSIAWCDSQGARAACCGVGLVPESDGLCGCPPGGATEEAAIAAGCSAGETDSAHTREALVVAMAPVIEAARSCYDAELGDHAALSGSLMLGFTVSPWGDLQDTRIDGATVPSPVVQRCILDALRSARVTPPLAGSEGLRVTYPVRLAPGDAP